MKVIRVDDDVHEIIVAMAEREDRKMTALVNRVFRDLASGKAINAGTVQREEVPTLHGVFTKRTKGDVLANIRNLEAERDGELENCQDRGTATVLHHRYQEMLDKLWAEYNEL